MRPGVPLQFVAACESFPAENPVADEGSLSGVQPDVSSEKRRFPERLLAADDVTDVLPLPNLPRPAERKHTVRSEIYLQVYIRVELSIQKVNGFEIKMDIKA